MKTLIFFTVLNLFSLFTFSQQAKDYLARGIEDFELGFIISAKENLDRCIEMDTTLADAYYYRGQCIEKGVRADIHVGCLSDYSKCIDLDGNKNYAEAYFYLAWGMTFFGDFFGQRYPNIPLIEGQVGQTIQVYFRRYYELNPGEKTAEQIAQVFFASLGANVGLDLVDYFIELHPKNQKLLFEKARIYQSISDWRNQEVVLRQLLRNSKKNGELYKLLSDCLQIQKNQGNIIDEKELDKIVKKAAKYSKMEK